MKKKEDLELKQPREDFNLSRKNGFGCDGAENPPIVVKELEGFRVDFRPLKAKHETKIRALQQEFGLFFRFYNGEIGPVRHTLEDNGFRETSHGDWKLFWSVGPIKEEVYKQLSSQQKVNHFIGSHEITRKDFLHKNLTKMKERYGVKSFNFTPSSWVLPLETNKLTKFLEGMVEPRKGYFIVKPPGLCQGKGIYITNDLGQVLLSKQIEPLVVSRYVDKPFLIDGYKFDLRIYVMITSVYPLRIYVYEEGLARFASEKYDISEEKLQNRFVHLTNYSLNKANEKFADDKHKDASTSSIKWRLSKLMSYLGQQNIDTKAISESIDDILIKTILSIEHILFENNVKRMRHNENCFEFLGFDIILDTKLRPWLLEVNLSPSLGCDSSLDFELKRVLISDFLNLVGVYANPRQNVLSSSKEKAVSFEAAEQKERQIQIMNAENKRKGGFRRLYPQADSQKYSKFFQEERPLNEDLINRYSIEIKPEMTLFSQKTYGKKWLCGDPDFGQSQDCGYTEGEEFVISRVPDRFSALLSLTPPRTSQ